MCSNVHQLLLPGLAIDEIAELPDDRLEIRAHCVNLGAACPLCRQGSMRVHSGYVRTLGDIPLGDYLVTLKVRVRRFRCDAPDCPRAIFTEPLTPLALRYARRTHRVTTVLKHLGVELGGNAAARLAGHLHLNVSATTMLRLVRQMTLPTRSPPRMIGVNRLYPK